MKRARSTTRSECAPCTINAWQINKNIMWIKIRCKKQKPNSISRRVSHCCNSSTWTSHSMRDWPLELCSECSSCVWCRWLCQSISHIRKIRPMKAAIEEIEIDVRNYTCYSCRNSDLEQNFPLIFRRKSQFSHPSWNPRFGRTITQSTSYIAGTSWSCSLQCTAFATSHEFNFLTVFRASSAPSILSSVK